MPFVGIIAEKKNENEIENILKEKFKEDNLNVKIININEKSIQNIKNIKFNAILINSISELNNFEEETRKILNEAKYLIINGDVNEIYSKIENIESIVLSYGFNSKSTITASSVSEDEIIICIQREFENNYNNKIEVQEVKIKNNIKNEYILMGIFTIFLIYGIKL